MRNLIMLIFLIGGWAQEIYGQGVPAAFEGATPLEWSGRMARSEMKRQGRSLFQGGAAKARWDYTSGLFAHALLDLEARTGDEAMRKFATEVVGSYIAEDGRIATYRAEDYNIDMVTPGRAVLEVYEKTREERFKRAAERLREQLAQQPRTSDGGFWHKKRYPWQMWLDGLYMGSPFLARYGRDFGEAGAFDEVVRQIVLMDRHAYDAGSGLYFHGWDEKREQSWANPTTGTSPSFWGRSIGWYAMAVVDCLEDVPADHPGVAEVQAILRRLAEGVARYQDVETGLWWQVVDQKDRPGNYKEASASAMFVYALAKGVRSGVLDHAKFLPVVTRGYEGLVKHCTRTDPDGSIHLTQICEVAGLGMTSAAGKPRDGTFSYYVSEPVVENDLKGVGPFILAGVEMAALKDAMSGGASAPGWGDVDGILARIQAPQFNQRDFSIEDYGAQAGQDVTAAIRAAIAACHDAGGGRVVVPPGEWRSGAIHLKSGVNLHFSKGAVVRFSTRPEDYPVVFTRWEGMECMNHSALIYAMNQRDIAVTGEGILDGQADWDTWWAWNDKKKGKPTLQHAARARLGEMAESGVAVTQRVFGPGSWLRPNFIQFVRCSNILIEDLSIQRSPMWEIHPVLSQNITIRRVKVVSHGTNNDGCDPESCRDVLIEDCLFDTGDDCIAIKSGRNEDGRRVNVPSENIIIRRCRMKDGHGGVVFGSEVSGGVRNVFIEDCEMDSPHLDRAFRFKSNARRGGVVENIFVRDVRIGHVAEAVLAIDFLYEEGAKGSHMPIVRNVMIENIVSRSSPRVMDIRGFKGAVIEGVAIRNCVFAGVSEEDRQEQAGEVKMENVTRLRAWDAVVAADGSGTHENVQAAIDAMPDAHDDGSWILIQPGIYQGPLWVSPAKRNMRLVGGGKPEQTILSYGKNQQEPDPDFPERRPGIGVMVEGDDFFAQNLTFQNRSGDHGQALALRVDGDRAVIRNCSLLGWQDTLMVNKGRQYFHGCYIEGRVDFIYGDGTAVFDRCRIHSKNGGYITAASTPAEKPYGFVFFDCVLSGDSTPWQASDPGKSSKPAKQPATFLGRPWRPHASVTFVRCQLGPHIRPEGWDHWRNPANEGTARYVEIASHGPGADPAKRVAWATSRAAENPSDPNPEQVLAGADGWNPARP